jgi:hypothetical protein
VALLEDRGVAEFVTDGDLSDALCSLIVHHVSSMEHVSLLLALKMPPIEARTAPQLAQSERLELPIVVRMLRDLQGAGVVQRSGDAFRYAPSKALEQAVEELERMYHTKPVALVRAINARPLRAVQSFADAFRIRPRDE